MLYFVNKQINRLREDRNQFALNLELQLLLRQGQVREDLTILYN